MHNNYKRGKKSKIIFFFQIKERKTEEKRKLGDIKNVECNFCFVKAKKLSMVLALI